MTLAIFRGARLA